MENEKLKLWKSVTTELEARLLVGKLKDIGVNALFIGGQSVTIEPLLGSSQNAFKVFVEEDDFELADKLFDELTK